MNLKFNGGFLQKNKSNKHAKLGEGWSEHKDPYKDGVVFGLKYLGSHLVEELHGGQSYASGKSAEVIRTIKNFRAMHGKKIPTERVELVVKSTGITVFQQETRRVIIESPIERISFCTADGMFPKVFAYIARNATNETMECYAFSCPNPRVANEVSQGVNQSFQLAKDELMAKQATPQSANTISEISNSPTDMTTNSPHSSSPVPDENKPDWVSFE